MAMGAYQLGSAGVGPRRGRLKARNRPDTLGWILTGPRYFPALLEQSPVRYVLDASPERVKLVARCYANART
jgi:hypothetical protein